MGNTVLTHQMIAREAAAMLMEASPFIGNINRGREEDFGSNTRGYKAGDTVKVRIPPASKVFDGATFAGGGSAPDQTETYINLTVDTQKHVPLTFTTKEKVLNLTEFKDRFLRPAMETLASVVSADLMAKAYLGIPNLVGTAGSLPTTMKTFGQARASLERYLAPTDGNRTAIISSDVNTEMVDSSKALFNPNKRIADMYTTGVLGDAQGLHFFESQSLPTHTNGSKVAGVTVNGASQSGNMLNIGGLTGGDTIKKGSVFTIAGVYAMNPLSGVAYPQLRQFVVTADFTASGATGSISIFPAIGAVAPGATVSAAPANGAALTFVGAASTGYRQDLVFQKDAFAAAFVPLPVIASCEGYTARAGDMSVRVMTFGDGKADQEHTRIDVMYGFTTVRGDHAVRVTE